MNRQDLLEFLPGSRYALFREGLPKLALSRHGIESGPLDRCAGERGHPLKRKRDRRKR